MKTINILSLLLIILIFSSFSTSGLTTGAVKVFQPHIDYEFTGQASGQVTWADKSIQYVNLNITATKTPNNISRIYIDVVRMDLVGLVNGVETPTYGYQNATQAILSTTNNTLIVNASITTPTIFDRFYVKITITARSDGNITRDDYTMRFPDSTGIVVQKNNVVPLIDLYGFPPNVFFNRFLPIYVILLFIVAIPGITFASIRTKQKLGRKSDQKEEEE